MSAKEEFWSTFFKAADSCSASPQRLEDVGDEWPRDPLLEAQKWFAPVASRWIGVDRDSRMPKDPK